MIVCSFVVKNEQNRYFSKSLELASKIFDEVFVFDDSSEDGTVDLAWKYTHNVFLNDSESFMEHEGKFRSNAWNACIDNLSLTEDDWIFVNDADEFISLEGIDNCNLTDDEAFIKIRSCLEEMISKDCSSYKIHIPDVKKIVDEKIFVRTDGFWNMNYAPRFAKALKLPFMNKKMGSFSIPEKFVVDSCEPSDKVKLLHFGYVKEDDALERFNRYSNLKNHGHNPNHIKSIMKNPSLKPWNGWSYV